MISFRRKPFRIVTSCHSRFGGDGTGYAKAVPMQEHRGLAFFLGFQGRPQIWIESERYLLVAMIAISYNCVTIDESALLVQFEEPEDYPRLQRVRGRLLEMALFLQGEQRARREMWVSNW
ncbi:MAG TPA: hypothetical protein VMF68_02790 [Spirochaetia bacterium]|nr:hypothetical protein [Spirochaetia bacterium]